MPLTQLHPGCIGGRLYGDFSGRTGPHPVEWITCQHAGAMSGRRYGSFAGRTPFVPPHQLATITGGSWHGIPGPKRWNHDEDEAIILAMLRLLRR